MNGDTDDDTTNAAHDKPAAEAARDEPVSPAGLRAAGWGVDYNVFTRKGREGDFHVFEAVGRWFWASRDGDPAELTGMAYVAVRLAAATEEAK